MPLRRPELDALVVLRAAGVGLVLEVSGGRLPAVAHWGADLGELDEAAATALVDATWPLPAPNDVDAPVRLAVVPEASTGWMGRPGLQGSRNGRDWSTSFTTTSVTLDDEPVAGFAAGGAGSVHVLAGDDEAELELAVTIELLPSGLVRGRAAIANVGDEPYSVDGLVVAFPVPAEATELLDFTGRWSRERTPQRRTFGAGTHLRENRRGRTGADSAYVLHAGTSGFGFAAGRIHAVHAAHSGNHVHYAERTSGRRLLGGGELLLPGEVGLRSHETYEGPWVYGSFGVGLDEVAQRFHSHLRSRPGTVSADRPITLNVWEAVYFDHDAVRLKVLADRAAAVGVERFVLDDGWFGGRRHDRAGLGDWVVSPDAWPEGLHPLVDHVRSLGMHFGLWFEPEMVNADSDVARAHPEWVMSARRAWPVESRHQQVLNLAIPDAYEHVRTHLMAILDEYDIDYVKWDHNRDLVEAGDQLDGHRPAVHRQTCTVYRLLDELRSAHPRLEIESCSSGGGRIDLGILERTDRVWVSDCNDPLERQHMARWTTQLVPPEMMGAHIAAPTSHTTGRTHDLSFRAATAVFGHLGIEWDLTTASDAELDELRAWLTWFKAHRGLLLGGDLVRMDTHDDHTLVHGVVAPDRSEAIFAMVLTGSVEAPADGRVRFRGLDSQATYRLRPIIVGAPTGLLQAPAWWGSPAHADGRLAYPGVVLTGATIEHVGVAAPILYPEHAVLFHAELEQRP